jgi:hypothetical protein
MVTVGDYYNTHYAVLFCLLKRVYSVHFRCVIPSLKLTTCSSVPFYVLQQNTPRQIKL